MGERGVERVTDATTTLGNDDGTVQEGSVVHSWLRMEFAFAALLAA